MKLGQNVPLPLRFWSSQASKDIDLCVAKYRKRAFITYNHFSYHLHSYDLLEKLLGQAKKYTQPDLVRTIPSSHVLTPYESPHNMKSNRKISEKNFNSKPIFTM